MFKSANVTLMVSDVNRSVKFYTEALGLKLTRQYGPEWAEVEAPGLTIGLHPAREPAKTPPSENLSIGFAVENLESAMTDLKKRGVAFTPQIKEDSPVRLAFFTDPDKNPLYLSEEKRNAGKGAWH